jgi:hypothetical protein
LLEISSVSVDKAVSRVECDGSIVVGHRSVQIARDFPDSPPIVIADGLFGIESEDPIVVG